MGERFRTRAMVVSRAIAARAWPRPPAPEVRRVLLAQSLKLGDTLMLTPLLAKLRAAHPQAEITLLAEPAAVPLYQRRPYGVRALPFAPRDSATTRALFSEPPFDLALVAGHNRYGWLAAALRARHIVAHAGDPAWIRGWMVDERRPYPQEPAALGDLLAGLADGPAPRPYARGDWDAPDCTPFERPAGPYAVLHVGASTPLKEWLPERWAELAEALAARGLQVAWSGGPGEERLVAGCDPKGRFASFAGRLDLPQLWHLLAGARLVVAPDTGTSHLARVAWAPCVTLFGPGSPVLGGAGDFWRDVPWVGVGAETFACRDQQLVFRRTVAWARRCERKPHQCAAPRCMHAIAVPDVLAAVGQLEGRFAR